MKSTATIRLVEVTETVKPQDYFHWYVLYNKGEHPQELTDNERHLVVTVGKFYGLGIEDVMSPNGVRPRAECKQMIWMLLTDLYGTKNVHIARFFKRNHASVINGIKRIRGLILYDKEVKENYEAILKLL